jgi:hypothetical protein
MPGQFDDLGISFQYPDNWSLDAQEAPDGRKSVTVFSPTGAFWSISIHPQVTDLMGLALEAIDAIREEYGDTDVVEVEETVSGHELTGYDLNFFSMDLTSTARIRCFRSDQAALAVFCQAEDSDFERLYRVFDAITISLLRGQGHSRIAE